MNFQLKVLLLSFVVSVILGAIIIPILRKLKVGQIERTDGPQSHLQKQGTPTMGGIIMALTLANNYVIEAVLQDSKSENLDVIFNKSITDYQSYSPGSKQYHK